MSIEKQLSHSNHLRVTKEFAEIEPPENHFVKELKIKKEEYE